MNRRLLLQLFGSSTLLMGGGCLNWSDESARICMIHAFNTIETSHKVRVRLSEEGETVYEETHALEPEEAIVVEGAELPVREGQLTLQAQLDDNEEEEVFLPEQTGETTSLDVELHIKSNSSLYVGTVTVDC